MTWLKRARAVLVMGVVWAGGGALIGGVIELIDNIMPGILPFVFDEIASREAKSPVSDLTGGFQMPRERRTVIYICGKTLVVEREVCGFTLERIGPPRL